MNNKDVQKNYRIIIESFSYQELIKFKNTSEKNLIIYHFGFGTWIRNNLLNETCALYKFFIDSGINNKDDMSAIILKTLHNFLNSL